MDMKIRDGYLLRKVGSDHIVVTVGKASEEFRGMIKLNDTAAFIWKAISDGLETEQIVEKLTEQYEVSQADAEQAVLSMVKNMKDNGILA